MSPTRSPGGRSRLTIILLLVTTITVLTLDARGSAVIGELRNLAATVASPFRGVADTIASPFRNSWQGAFNYDEVRDERDQLAQRVRELEAQQITDADARTQLQELQRLHDLPQLSSIPSVTARITSGPRSNFDRTIELGKGSDHGIKVGMPVAAGGLVGRVTSVTGSTAIVRLINDPRLSVGVKFADSQTIVVATGQGPGQALRAPAVPPDVVVAEGEEVTTSGQHNSLYPPDLAVGRVASVELSADRLEQIVSIEPLVDFTKLSYVTVLLYERPGP